MVRLMKRLSVRLSAELHAGGVCKYSIYMGYNRWLMKSLTILPVNYFASTTEIDDALSCHPPGWELTSLGCTSNDLPQIDEFRFP